MKKFENKKRKINSDELNEKDLSDNKIIEFYKRKLYLVRLEIDYLKVLRKLKKYAMQKETRKVVLNRHFPKKTQIKIPSLDL
ncbi:hypothetical protein LNO75_02785 [Mycoplasma sp. T363T]|uniref:hypothetical protein n=1 Tax=Mycoplasma bradburyae TaxID=2963128 RepID=UPI0023417014|nr:hypothetical protein [Mycoplasma bradburyae]MDC4163501.1 hypothetical protein [Mycoplasma bradburyae]